MAKSIISILALLVLTQLSTFVAAQQIIDVFRWVVPYSGPKEFEARVGDTIVFRWAQGGHNVYIHPSMSCDLEGAIFVGATPGTPYTFTEADGSPEGTDMFFSCDIGNGAHCQAGQSITVTVFSDPASVSPSIPATNVTVPPTSPESVLTTEDSEADVTEPPTSPESVLTTEDASTVAPTSPESVLTTEDASTEPPTSSTTLTSSVTSSVTNSLRGTANSDFISANATDFPTVVIDDNTTDVNISQVSDEPVVVDDAPNATVVEEPVIAEEAPNTTMVDEPVVDEPAVDEPAVDEPVVADEAAPTDTSVVDEPAVTDEAAPTEATEMPAEDVETADTDVDAAEGASGGRANSVASLVGLAFACLAFVLV